VRFRSVKDSVLVLLLLTLLWSAAPARSLFAEEDPEDPCEQFTDPRKIAGRVRSYYASIHSLKVHTKTTYRSDELFHGKEINYPEENSKATIDFVSKRFHISQEMVDSKTGQLKLAPEKLLDSQRLLEFSASPPPGRSIKVVSFSDNREEAWGYVLTSLHQLCPVGIIPSNGFDSFIRDFLKTHEFTMDDSPDIHLPEVGIQSQNDQIRFTLVARTDLDFMPVKIEITRIEVHPNARDLKRVEYIAEAPSELPSGHVIPKKWTVAQRIAFVPRPYFDKSPDEIMHDIDGTVVTSLISTTTVQEAEVNLELQDSDFLMSVQIPVGTPCYKDRNYQVKYMWTVNGPILAPD